MFATDAKVYRFGSAARLLGGLLLLAAAAVASSAVAQDRNTPGKSIGTVTTHDNLIILTLNEDALGKPHLFDLAHRTLRFTPDGSRYRVEALPEAWDNDFGNELKDPHATLSKITFPFSGQKWNEFSVGVTGSITFGAPPPAPSSRGRGGLPVQS